MHLKQRLIDSVPDLGTTVGILKTLYPEGQWENALLGKPTWAGAEAPTEAGRSDCRAVPDAPPSRACVDSGRGLR